MNSEKIKALLTGLSDIRIPVGVVLGLILGWLLDGGSGLYNGRIWHLTTFGRIYVKIISDVDLCNNYGHGNASIAYQSLD